MDVVRNIVDNNLCIGCGVCSASCPFGAINMRWNEHGEIVPEINDKCTDCGVCLNTCPFNIENDNTSVLTDRKYKESIDGFDDILGYYNSLKVGYVANEKHRRSSASGGLGSYFQYKLLEKGLVDYVINVTGDGKFQFAVHSSKEDVLKGCGSAYYPVTMEEVLSYVSENEGRYAIIALPCFLKGLELLKAKNKIFRERITYSFGLVCGQLKSSLFAEDIAQSIGIDKEEYKNMSVRFRHKVGGKTAGDFVFRYFSPESGKEYLADWKKKVDFKWGTDLYTLQACITCDDMFAECADMVFMDAWLPEYSKDNKGHSIVISRRTDLTALIEEGLSEQEIVIEDISPKKVKHSQDNVVFAKQELLNYRLGYIFQEFKDKVRIRRHINVKLSHKITERLKLRVLKSCRKKSKLALGFNLFVLKMFKRILKFVGDMKGMR